MIVDVSPKFKVVATIQKWEGEYRLDLRLWGGGKRTKVGLMIPMEKAREFVDGLDDLLKTFEENNEEDSDV